MACSEIADKPSHLRWADTLLWLARLATQLQEPADMGERVSKYPSFQIARLDTPAERDTYRQVVVSQCDR